MPTLHVPNTDSAIIQALVTQYNALHDDVQKYDTTSDGYGKSHFDITSVEISIDYLNPTSTACQASYTPDPPVTLAQACVAANVLANTYSRHDLDSLSHKAIDSYTDTYVDGYAVDLPSLVALVNNLKTWNNGHNLSTVSHAFADTQNQAATANATDLGSAISLITNLKTCINGHILTGPLVGKIKLKRF